MGCFTSSNSNRKRVLACFLLISGFMIILQAFYTENFNSYDATTSSYNIILWWTPMLGQYTKKCGNSNCLFTNNRKYQNHPNLKAFLFYGSHINITDVPLPREQKHIWALLHEESPKNIPFILFEPAITLFNITSTFSRYSNLPLTLQYLRHAKDITTKRHWRSVGEKNDLQIHGDLAPVLYMQSICDTLSFRDDYVKELGAFIRIDSYGQCLNNKTLPKYLQENYIEKLFDDELLRFIARYKFVIAYENGLCDDYITEKLWRALIVGVVPIYFGTRTVTDWLPNSKSAVLIQDFKNPEELAEFIHELNTNDTKYSEYLTHKENIISNQFLLDQLHARDTSTNMFEEFECFVCEKHGETVFAPTNSYNCEQNLEVLESPQKVNNEHVDWNDIMRHASCEAQVLNYFVLRNKQFSPAMFNQEIMFRYENGSCS